METNNDKKGKKDLFARFMAILELIWNLFSIK